jgi:hypothetical protein
MLRVRLEPLHFHGSLGGEIGWNNVNADPDPAGWACLN